jgi:ubiquinol-cytochrome c reductase cytochrome c subunit
MRSARPSPFNVRLVHRARIVPLARIALLTVTLTVGALGAAGQAEDATHWLVPSRHATSKGTLFEAGIPPSDESPVRVDRAQLLREGKQLYDVHCATCHAIDLSGREGAPSLLSSGGASVDFYVSTGRMPAAVQAGTSGPPLRGLTYDLAPGIQDYHSAPLFDARQTAAIVTYVTAHAKTTVPIPAVHLDPAKLQRGRLLFEDNCQACHGAGAQGATAGGQWTALPLNRATPTQIGEAIRIGPGVMPRFTSRQLPDDDVNAIATYVRYLIANSQTYGGTVMDYLGPISEGAVSAFIGVGFLFWVIYFTGTKTNGRRFNEIDD